jgi:hypothetical protein
MACWTAAWAAAGQVDQGHHRQRLWMPASPPVADATAAATATLLQEVTVPGEFPASTAAGGRPAEEQARSSTGTSTVAPVAAGRQPCCLLDPGDAGFALVRRCWRERGDLGAVDCGLQRDALQIAMPRALNL